MRQTTLVSYETHSADIQRIRQHVFVGEQGVPKELEFDGLDHSAQHALSVFDGQAVGTGRILDDGHIGRVAVLADMRGRGIGRSLMQALIAYGEKQAFPVLWLSAQCHAASFYEFFGFIRYGAVFYEAGIEHISMRKVFTSSAN